MEIRERIRRLKQEQDAVILAHYYVRDEVQEIADYIGDSFYLSKLAVDLPQKTLLVCGVSFMGESAKILNPGKRVLLPDPKADCAMAHVITPEKTEAFIIPKGTLVKLNTGVWHLSPYPIHNEVLHLMIVMPERVYGNDCVVCDYPEDQHIEIVL